jgi:nitroreductase
MYRKSEGVNVIMLYNKPIEEIIKSRYSVRNYDNKLIDEEIVKKIENYINKVSNPFDIKVRVKLLKKEDIKSEAKIGTYGVIKGENYYLAAACEKKEFSLEALGYTFENVVLYCTSLGLGTVWLGGTFNKGEFAKAMKLKENELLPIVSPLGYEGGNKSLLGKLMGDHRNKRKKYSDLFFDGSFDKPLIYEETDKYGKTFEMVRLAPSSVNSQPWRMIKEGNNIHIYSINKTEMNKVDIGIALCHLDLYLKESGINGEFNFVNPNIESKYRYVISWEKSDNK